MADKLADMEEQSKSLVGGCKEVEDLKEQVKTRTKADFSRAVDFVKDLKDLPDDSPFKQALRCFLKWCVKPLIVVIMVYVWVGKQLYKVYKMLPVNLINMIFGIGLCFFGGVYFTAIAAIEVARNFGGSDMWDHLTTCWQEANQIAEATHKDDLVDANNDYIADVQQMSTNELINHKAKVAMMAVKDPQRLQKAIVALLNIYILVIASLKFQFAKTVAVALGIADMFSLTIVRIAGPIMCSVMGPDLNNWVPTIIDSTVKLVAVVVASYIQAYISAFYSGLRGGQMVALAIFNIMTERGWMEKLPDSLVSKPFDPDRSYLDECIQYPLAAVGFYMQIQRGFTLDFPWNLICLPLTIVEWFLRFQVYT
mmetsp:Transcript_97685/g.252609  ORF Transcript_97685/g.252609 Transcript_97685/m.252609 type:complete len:367 (-) Transcript_97685:72-1172(-)